MAVDSFFNALTANLLIDEFPKLSLTEPGVGGSNTKCNSWGPVLDTWITQHQNLIVKLLHNGEQRLGLHANTHYRKN